MGAGLEKLAGGKMQGVLQKLTSSTIKGVIFGLSLIHIYGTAPLHMKKKQRRNA